MNARAQVSLELMLLVMAMLLYLQTSTLPMVQLSSKAVQDVGSVGKARLAFDAVHDSIAWVGHSTGESRRTLEVFLPAQTRLSCDAGQASLSFAVSLDPSLERVPACAQDQDNDDFQCSHSKAFGPGFKLGCRTRAWQGPGWKTVSIEKVSGVVTVE
ncbi:MAG: hypothetical protein J4203_01330 [Candidatus Diapherotrites archaeon]|uniref:Class III signal peptide-containing protein n=1 Tax=Candidatus Iainarchaeum sp. TaxID=3101447 RepID=A0A8T4LCW0_9ARCH|nr:hypothetical protein [Candidatus Diapherotrites archaeon]